jgi:hypothetical protein
VVSSQLNVVVVGRSAAGRSAAPWSSNVGVVEVVEVDRRENKKTRSSIKSMISGTLQQTHMHHQGLCITGFTPTTL